MTQNLVILPGCPKAKKRTPPFPNSSRATLRQQPPGNRRRHKTLARTMDQAILSDRNGWEKLVNFFVVKSRFLYLTGEVSELCFLKLSLCTFGANAAALVVSAGKGFIRRRALICFARSVPCGRSLNNVAFANSYYFDTHSAALHYCTQAVSETVCFVCHYLLQIKYSAFCTRCSEFWNSVREKHNSFYAKTNKIGNDLFVFYKLPLLSTFLLPPTTLPLFRRPCISAENLKALKTEKRLQLVATNPGWQSVQFVSLFVPKKSIALMA